MGASSIRRGDFGETAGVTLPRSMQSGTRAHASRTVARLEPGLILVTQQVNLHRRRLGLDVSGPFWICGLVRLFRGRVRYRCEDRFLEPPGRWFGMFMPPYSLVEVELDRCRAITLGYAFSGRMPEALPQQPVLFRPIPQEVPAGRREIISVVLNGRDITPAGREENADELSLSLKNAIDHSYCSPYGLGNLSRSLGMSPSCASRRFRKAYGLTPGRYRHSLRVLDAMLRLAEGQPICEVFQDVGYQDLSRFYSQFRKIACAPPGRYRFLPEKNAKT